MAVFAAWSTTNVGLSRPKAARMPGLRGSSTHVLAGEIYQRHWDAGMGMCVTCGNPVPCAPGVHAAAVLHAVGDDLDAYPPRRWPDPEVHHPVRSGPPPEPEPAESEVYGFAVSGRSRPLNPSGFGYERDQR